MDQGQSKRIKSGQRGSRQIKGDQGRSKRIKANQSGSRQIKEDQSGSKRIKADHPHTDPHPYTHS